MNKLTKKNKNKTVSAHKKPSIAHVVEKIAKENILTKIHYLEQVASGNIVRRESDRGNNVVPIKPGKIWELLPKSVRQFNKWSWNSALGDTFSWEKTFLTNSHDTLCRYPELRLRLESALDLLKKLQHDEGISSSKSPNKLTRELKVAIARLKALEMEKIDRDLELHRTRSELSILKEKFESTKADLKLEINKLQEEISALRRTEQSKPDSVLQFNR
ncbi:hypothetical protein [Herbaspirillum huttiense]|uniref:hypothetical protein n=1 Tax=Herbaspirillum huttiense TaxID=863372 RepID=UPI0039B096F3